MIRSNGKRDQSVHTIAARPPTRSRGRNDAGACFAEAAEILGWPNALLDMMRAVLSAPQSGVAVGWLDRQWTECERR
jgi:hypothetical protein